MARIHYVRLVFALLCALVFPLGAWADLVASDNASSAAYNDGWQNGDNGGTGFSSWNSLGLTGGGNGGAFLATNDSNNQIGTGGDNAAWGLFANSTGVSQAIRPFPTPLVIGQTFNISMDNGFVDGGGTVGFGLQNSSGNNLFEFYFVGNASNYTANALNVSGTTPGFTNGGLRLAFSLTATNAFTFTMDLLSNGIGVDNTVTGNLIANANQQISTLRLFNANAGFNGDHNIYFNSISAVPEVSPIIAVPAALLIAGAVSFGWRRWRAKPAVAVAA